MKSLVNIQLELPSSKWDMTELIVLTRSGVEMQDNPTVSVRIDLVTLMQMRLTLELNNPLC